MHYLKLNAEYFLSCRHNCQSLCPLFKKEDYADEMNRPEMGCFGVRGAVLDYVSDVDQYFVKNGILSWDAMHGVGKGCKVQLRNFD